jgi:hypothetical protein
MHPHREVVQADGGQGRGEEVLHLLSFVGLDQVSGECL